MQTSITLTIAFLLCAIAFAIAAEKRKPATGARVVWCALVSSMGVCVGIVSMVLIFFFGLGTLASFAISTPLGILAFFVLAWLAGG